MPNRSEKSRKRASSCEFRVIRVFTVCAPVTRPSGPGFCADCQAALRHFSGIRPDLIRYSQIMLKSPETNDTIDLSGVDG